MITKQKLFSIIAALSLMIAIASGCSSRDTSRRLDFAESCMNSDPELALQTIDSIDTRSLLTRSRKARYALLKTMALDKNFIDTADINVILPAVEYYGRHGSPTEKMRAYYYSGIVYSNADDDSMAHSFYILADDEVSESSDYYTAGLIKTILADIFSREYNSPQELKYTEDALHYAKLARDTIGEWYYSGRLAGCYYNNKKKAESDSLYEVFLAKPILDTSIYVNEMLLYAKSMIYRHNSDYQKSIALFRQALAFQTENIDSSYYGVFALASEMDGKSNVADSLCILAKNSETIDVYKYMIAKRRGDTQAALESLERAINHQDSVVQLTLNQSTISSQRNYYSDKAAFMEIVFAKERFQKFIAIGLTIILLLILSLSCLYWKYIRTRNEAYIAQLKNQLQETSSNQASSDNLKKEYFQLFREQFEMIDSLCSTYYSDLVSNKKERIFREVENEVKKLSYSPASMKKLHSFIDERLDNMMTRIRIALPHHSDRDFALIAYLVIGLDAKTISLLLSISSGTVYTKKNRFRKEIMELQSEEDRNFFLGCLAR
ncbi:MAG: hypothetical protein ACI3ZC_03910 [Candidatus Cryptobacteroides sp.]